MSNKKSFNASKLIIRYGILAIFCMVIFWFSDNNGQESTNYSSKIVDIICKIFFPNLYMEDTSRVLAVRDVLTVLVRKGAHLLIYTMLGAVAYVAFFPVKRDGIRLFLAVMFAFFYACTDEIHQLFVVDRTGKISDVFIDTIGGFLGAFVIFAISSVHAARKIIKENNINGI